MKGICRPFHSLVRYVVHLPLYARLYCVVHSFQEYYN